MIMIIKGKWLGKYINSVSEWEIKHKKMKNDVFTDAIKSLKFDYLTLHLVGKMDIGNSNQLLKSQICLMTEL